MEKESRERGRRNSAGLVNVREKSDSYTANYIIFLFIDLRNCLLNILAYNHFK